MEQRGPSGTVRVDPPWDDSPGKDLVEIARRKFKEAERARERPDAIENLLVHCDYLRYIAADPRFTFGDTKGSCARISRNCQHNREVRVGTLAS